MNSHLYFLVEGGGNFICLLLWCHDSLHLHSDIHEMANPKEMTAICYQEACLESLGSQLRLVYNCIRILIVPYTMLVSCFKVLSQTGIMKVYNSLISASSKSQNPPANCGITQVRYFILLVDLVINCFRTKFLLAAMLICEKWTPSCVLRTQAKTSVVYTWKVSSLVYCRIFH